MKKGRSTRASSKKLTAQEIQRPRGGVSVQSGLKSGASRKFEQQDP